MDRKTKIQKLIKEGYTYKEIGIKLSISKQRVHQINNNYKTKRKKHDITEIPESWKPNKSYKKYRFSNLSGRDFLKEKVRARDNYICQICKKKWVEGERRFDVHHIDKDVEGVNGLKYSACKNLDRQITLCHRCHMNLAHIKEKMTDFYIKRKLFT
jgi:hypothetical protein